MEDYSSTDEDIWSTHHMEPRHISRLSGDVEEDLRRLGIRLGYLGDKTDGAGGVQPMYGICVSRESEDPSTPYVPPMAGSTGNLLAAGGLSLDQIRDKLALLARQEIHAAALETEGEATSEFQGIVQAARHVSRVEHLYDIYEELTGRPAIDLPDLPIWLTDAAGGTVSDSSETVPPTPPGARVSPLANLKTIHVIQSRISVIRAEAASLSCLAPSPIYEDRIALLKDRMLELYLLLDTLNNEEDRP